LIDLAAQGAPFFTRPGVVLLVHFEPYFPTWAYRRSLRHSSPQALPPSGSEDEDSIIEDVHEIISSTSATKRKRNVEPQNLAGKKPKKPAAELDIIDEVVLLVTRLGAVEQD
jgi:hypothetical protein